ncbi:MAG: alpha/beta hydrolase [Clostridia bacterium]|nr:alpha/beta hydrolase [Clostridia bacterium]
MKKNTSRKESIMKFRTIQNNPSLTGLAEISPDIVYAEHGGKKLTMRVLTPWKNGVNEACRYPLIFFIQGSGWTFPNINCEIPQLGWYARHGYVVATVTHRNSNDGFPFPAFLEDVKCALRYLRAHAQEFRIDPSKVTAFGTSSGGNTALLLGLTGDDPRYKTEEYADQSDAVSAVVEAFGPTDMAALRDYYTGGDSAKPFKTNLLGEDADVRVKNTHDISPLCIVKDGAHYPPFLLMHGSADPVVPYETQALPMANRLDEAGADVTLIRVDGAEHEGNFWSDELHDIILEFIDGQMK